MGSLAQQQPIKLWREGRIGGPAFCIRLYWAWTWVSIFWVSNKICVFSNPKNSKKIALEGHKRLENYPQILHQLYELKIWIYWKLFSDNLGTNNSLYCCSFAKLYLFLLLCSQICNYFHLSDDLENSCWWVWEVCCLWCVKSINICCF
jgi:hypothetical protein